MTEDQLDHDELDWFESFELTPEQRAAGEALMERIRRPIPAAGSFSATCSRPHWG